MEPVFRPENVLISNLSVLDQDSLLSVDVPLKLFRKNGGLYDSPAGRRFLNWQWERHGRIWYQETACNGCSKSRPIAFCVWPKIKAHIVTAQSGYEGIPFQFPCSGFASVQKSGRENNGFTNFQVGFAGSYAYPSALIDVKRCLHSSKLEEVDNGYYSSKPHTPSGYRVFKWLVVGICIFGCWFSSRQFVAHLNSLVISSLYFPLLTVREDQTMQTLDFVFILRSGQSAASCWGSAEVSCTGHHAATAAAKYIAATI